MIKTLSASDLLHYSIEIIASFPEGKDYEERKLRTPHQEYKYKEVLALMRAFGITEDFPGFVSGAFTASRSDEVYTEILLGIRKTLKKYPPEVVTKRKLSQIFQLSFGFLVALYQVQRYWKNYLIADPALLYPQVASKNLNKGMIRDLSKLKAMLCKIIDPMEKEIPISELILKYGYPEIEIRETDNY